MADPWVKREAGELLSSADWNGMQRLAKEEIAKVEARVAAVEAGEKRGTQLVVAQMVANEGSFENGGGSWLSGSNQFGPGVNITGLSNQYYWDFVPSPTLRFTLTSTSIVQLSAQGTIYSNSPSHILWTQFILGQNSKRTPARIQGNPDYGLRHTLNYGPDATTWARWLADNDSIYTANSKRWPLCGLVANYNSIYQPFAQREQVELPVGSYSTQLGYSTSATAGNGYSWQLYGLTLSATIIPV